jgi:hypothetical protein
MNAEQWAQYNADEPFDAGPEDWQATFAWISWRDGLCYPRPHHAPDRVNYAPDGRRYRESLFTVICCDLISVFWVVGKMLARGGRKGCDGYRHYRGGK